MDKETEKLLGEQIRYELESAYLYLGISNYYAEKALNGFASWFKKQAEEEVEHAEKIRDYLLQENRGVPLYDIRAPKIAFKDYKEPLLLQLEHEKEVTSLIEHLYGAAIKGEDLRTARFLDWFINEQAEEEATAQELIDKFELTGGEGLGLYLLNEELGKR